MLFWMMVIFIFLLSLLNRYFCNQWMTITEILFFAKKTPFGLEIDRLTIMRWRREDIEKLKIIINSKKFSLECKNFCIKQYLGYAIFDKSTKKFTIKLLRLSTESLTEAVFEGLSYRKKEEMSALFSAKAQKNKINQRLVTEILKKNPLFKI